MPVRIFLSATFADLREERLEVIEVIRRMRVTQGLDVDLITMEDFGFSTHPPLAKCFEMLKQADAYLGLLGHRYGSTPPGSKLSYTEREYKFARQQGLPIYILERTGLVDSQAIESIPERLKRLQELKRHARQHHLVLAFNGPNELGKLLAQFLTEELRKSFSRERLLISDPAMQGVPMFQLKDRPKLISEVDETIRNIDVLAISAVGLVRDRQLVESALKRGCRVRLLVCKRGGIAHQLLLIQGDRIDISADLDQIVSRGRRYRSLVKEHGWPGSFHMREIDWTPSCTLFILNSGLPSAIGWVGIYTPDISSPAGSKWVLELTPRCGSEALQFHVEQFQRLWDKATPIE